MSLVAESLCKKGFLSETDLRRAEEVCRRIGGRLPATLARLGLVAETDLAVTIAEIRQLPLNPTLSCGEGDFADINARFLARRSIVPLALDCTSLRVAMADPEDEEAVAALAFATSVQDVRIEVATFSDIAEAVAARHGAMDDPVNVEG